MGSPATGDAALAGVVSSLRPAHARRAAVTVVDGSVSRAAFLGADESTRFEIGSVTKALTGMLLADLIGAGRCRLDDPLASLDDRYGGSAVGAVTVRQLCTHSSGLPRLPGTWRTAVRGLELAVFGADPYRGVDADRVVRDASRQRLGRPGYSNLGAAVLGNALARRESTTYAALVRRRVLDPLGLDATGVACQPSFRADRGRTALGGRAAPWAMSGYAPAGGLTSTPRDLARLLVALVRRDGPGTEALRPLAGLPGGGRIGMFWMVADLGDGRTRTWHNGRTGGYASYLAVDDRRGVVAVADVADSVAVERLARSALG